MWLKRNYKTIIRLSYIIPILFAAGVSIAHVVTWYGMTNPLSWAIYLSVGVEIAALSSLAGITAKMNKWVYLPFLIVTLIQFIGNVFFHFQFIDMASTTFKAWVDLVNPLFDWIGMATSGDLIAHKRWLALFSGGLIPVISLSFLHLLISFNDKDEAAEAKKNDPPKIDPTKEVLEDLRDKMIEDSKILTHNINDEVKRTFIVPVGPIKEAIEPEQEITEKYEQYNLVEKEPIEEIKETITEANVTEPIEDIHPPIYRPTGDISTNNRMNIERVGSNKIIKDVNPHEVVYKRDA